MAVAEIDMSGETAESLETGGPGGRSAWLGQQILKLVVTITMVAGGFGFAAVCWVTVERHRLLFVLLLIVLGIAGLLGATVIAISVRRGLPKAPKTPEDAIGCFVLHTLPCHLIAPIHAEGYLLLLDGAKRKVKEFAGFKAYWTGVRTNLLKEVREQLNVKRVDFIRCLSTKLKPVAQEHGLLIYEALIQVEAYIHKMKFGAGTSQEVSVGVVCYRERFSVAEVEGRWYLSSPYWTGEPIEPEGVQSLGSEKTPDEANKE